jgi:hypothetical protein
VYQCPDSEGRSFISMLVSLQNLTELHLASPDRA